MAKLGRPRKKRGPGRPKGTKDKTKRKRVNKFGAAVKRIRSLREIEDFEPVIRRGRPRKNPVIIQQVVKRGPGRPRKNPLVETVIKRGPGRPRKFQPRSVGMNKTVLRNVKKLVLWT